MTIMCERPGIDTALCHRHDCFLSFQEKAGSEGKRKNTEQCGLGSEKGII